MPDSRPPQEQMPLLFRGLGVWEGTYTRVDATGSLMDQHRARITCSVRPDGVYQQVNEYTWEDGHREEIQVRATIREGRLMLDTERIRGEAWEAGGDAIVSRWSYRHDPTGFQWGLTSLTVGDSLRTRCQQHFSGGELVAFTLVVERRVG